MLENLQPQKVFKYFEEICSIPHGSGNTKAISDYCINFAKKRDLSFAQDEYNNVIITKEATPGYESAPAIIIQGHMDMVCEKDENCDIDFEAEGLRLAIDGDYVYAKGTTLGGDDGIAVAYALAILDSEEIAHPKLECIFTVDEEIGMLGAAAIDLSSITGNLLLNIDSEKEGILTVSCAGGATVESTVPVIREEAGARTEKYRIKVGGLKGGHSGVEIDKEHGNAIKLLARVMYEINENAHIGIYSIEGGLKDNAIPVGCRCDICANSNDYDIIEKIVKKYDKIYKNEFMTTDSDVEVTICAIESDETEYSMPMNKKSGDDILFLLYNIPNGVQGMSKNIEGLVETSLNAGILKTKDDSVIITSSVRSSITTKKEALIKQLNSLALRVGGKCVVEGSYTPWEYKKDSKLRNLMEDVYEKQYGEKPEIAAVHAGLECGVFSEKIENLDCVSFGPDMDDIHTSKERLSISSTERCFEYLVEVLKRSIEL